MRVTLCTDGATLLAQPGQVTRHRPDVVVCPELMDGGYAAIARGAQPHTVADNTLRIIQDFTRRHDVCVIAGSFFFRHNTRKPTNTSLVFSRGRIVRRYDKIHLFKPTGDTTYFQPGTLPPALFTINTRHRVRAGVVICYDLRFSELIRSLALQGMQVLFVPARWPKVRDEAWHSLLKARAIENQIFVVGCNASDSEGGLSYGFDPFGKQIFSSRGRTKSPVHSLTLDLKLLTKARLLHNNIQEAVFLRKMMRKDVR